MGKHFLQIFLVSNFFSIAYWAHVINASAMQAQYTATLNTLMYTELRVMRVAMEQEISW